MTSRLNRVAPDIALAELDERGGYRIDHGGAFATTTLMSAAGMRLMVASSVAMERHAETLEAITQHLDRCEHGFDIGEMVELGEMSWDVCDYWCDPVDAPGAIIFLLSALHPDPDDWCWPAVYDVRGVGGPFALAGSLPMRGTDWDRR